VKFDELVGASWNPGLPVAYDSTGISAPDKLFTLGYPAVSGGATPNLGWIFWNQWHAGPSSEIYEVLIPIAD
jgi:hypothetical protein